MRIVITLTTFLSLFAISVNAQVPTEVMDNDVYVVSSHENPVFAMAAWYEGGHVKMLAGKDATKAPEVAVTYSARQVIWPTARVRVLIFNKENGGVLHPITDEITLYVLSGVAEVDVAGETVSVVAGDVVSFPSGALRNAGPASDATIVTWNAPSLTGETTPTYVPGASVEERSLSFLGLKRYQFPGNSVRYARQLAGLNSNPVTSKTDSLIYVTGGPMNFTENGKSFVVSEGDFIREVAGLEHNWNVKTESAFVTTSGKPLDMDVIDPNKATDIPSAR